MFSFIRNPSSGDDPVIACVRLQPGLSISKKLRLFRIGIESDSGVSLPSILPTGGQKQGTFQANKRLIMNQRPDARPFWQTSIRCVSVQTPERQSRKLLLLNGPFCPHCMEIKLKLIHASIVPRGLCCASVLVVAGMTSSCGMQPDANYAEVTSVKPAMRTVNVPREECRDKIVTLHRETQDPHKITGTVAGAVVGGVLGNQVGGGSGKKIATVVGAVAGGYAGNKTQESMQANDTYQESQRVCTTVNEGHQEQAGYDVEYTLNGTNHKRNLSYDPGSRILVVNGQVSLKE